MSLSDFTAGAMSLRQATCNFKASAMSFLGNGHVILRAPSH
jgi:hypothetical protein